MTVGGINRNHVNTGIIKGRNAVNIISSNTNGSTYAQAAKLVFTSVREVFNFLNIFISD
jgi:hypothetical protein